MVELEVKNSYTNLQCGYFKVNTVKLQFLRFSYTFHAVHNFKNKNLQIGHRRGSSQSISGRTLIFIISFDWNKFHFFCREIASTNLWWKDAGVAPVANVLYDNVIYVFNAIVIQKVIFSLIHLIQVHYLR